MTKTTNAEVLFFPDSEEMRYLPEGPTSLGDGKFSWVAIQHGSKSEVGSLNVFDVPSGTNASYLLPGRPGFAKPTTRPGVFVVGCERELGIFDVADQSWNVLAQGVDADVEGTIINDGTLYANNLVFGTKDLEFRTEKAGVYLFRGNDGKLIRMLDRQICSNGKDVIDSGDGGQFLIDIDSPTKKIVRYRLDIEAAVCSEKEVVVDLGHLNAVPDGMTLTPDEQSLIVSFYNPNPADFGETHQYSLYNGALEQVWRTPLSPQATCPLLMEMQDESVKLIITTAVENMPAERRSQASNAGAIFVADTDFRRAPAAPAYPLEKIRI